MIPDRGRALVMKLPKPAARLKIPICKPGPKRKEESSATHPENPAVGNYHTHCQR